MYAQTHQLKHNHLYENTFYRMSFWSLHS